MVRNVGRLDRAIRAGLGVYLMKDYRAPGDFKSWRSAVGGYSMMTAASGYDPIYDATGVNTRKGYKSRPHMPRMEMRRLAFWR